MADDPTSPAPDSPRFCRACGYSLTAAPDFCTCPECGKTGAKALITCPPARPWPTWPRFLLGLFGIPLGTLGLAVGLMHASAAGQYVLPWMIAFVMLIAVAVMSLLVPLVVALHWSAQSTMPFQRRRRMISVLAIFALGAIVNLAIALTVFRYGLSAWTPTT